MALAFVIVLAFVVSGFASVVESHGNEAGEGSVGSRVSSLPSAQGHWDMSTLREGKLQNLADPTGATDGIIYDAVLSSDGAIGGSLDFNGASAAVECPDPSDLLKIDSGTVSAWIKSAGKAPETKKLRAAIVILENGEAATQEDIRLLGLLGEAAEDVYSEMVHGNGVLDVSSTIYTQTPVDVNVTYPHLQELNNFIALGNPDIYDYICFFAKRPGWMSCMMNIKNTIHGIGEPYLYTNDLEGVPLSNYTTSVAVLSGFIPSNETGVAHSAYIFVHEMSHAYCAWWSYEEYGTVKQAPVTGYHYHAQFRTDMHSTLGGMGWRDNLDGTWTAVAHFDPSFPSSYDFNDTDYNLDEYTIGLIPASEVVPSHLLVPDMNYSYLLPPGFTMEVTDSQITIDQIVAAEGPWWNEEDRQCIMLRCTNEYGDVFRGQGWGLFVGTVPPNDRICWYSGSADGEVEWRYGNARVCDGVWHNVAVSFTGTTGKLYVDGVLDIEWEIHAVAAADNVHTVIGCEDPTNPYFENWFNGSIDEVYIFNSVLTDAQVSELYDMQDYVVNDTFEDLVGWTIDDSGGTVDLDYTTDAIDPPSLELWKQMVPGGTRATLEFEPQSGMFYMDVKMKAACSCSDNQGYGYLLVGNSTITFAFRNGYFAWYDQVTEWNYIMDFEIGTTYLVGFNVDVPRGTYDIYIDGELRYDDARFRFGAGVPIHNLAFQAGWYNLKYGAHFWVDDLRIVLDPLCAVPPDPPTLEDVVVNQAGPKVGVYFAAPIDNGGSPLTKFCVYRATRSGNAPLVYRLVATIEDPNAQWYEDFDVDPKKTYYYYVTCWNDFGESDPSNALWVRVK